jgi:hypothetical protein
MAGDADQPAAQVNVHTTVEQYAAHPIEFLAVERSRGYQRAGQMFAVVFETGGVGLAGPEFAQAVRFRLLATPQDGSDAETELGVLVE